MEAHDFHEKLAYSEDPKHEEFWRRVYAKAFPEFLNFMPMHGNNEAQRRGIDRILGMADGRVVRIEEKQRPKYRPDILLEYLSNDRTGAPGWIEKDLKCHYLAYAFMDLPLVYLFPWPLLQGAWRANREQWLAFARDRWWGFEKVPGVNPGYTTYSVAVPTRLLFQALEEVALAWNPVLVVGTDPNNPTSRPMPTAPEFCLLPPTGTAKDLVEQVLSEQPDTRRSVNRLDFAVWGKQGFNLSPSQMALIDQLIPAETIRRQSRKIMNEEGKYRP